MHWVYIMECEYGRLYVGETTRLYRRFWEHSKGDGGVNTRIFKPVRLSAIYKVQTLGKFQSYDYDVDWVVNNDPDNNCKKYKKWKLIKFEDDDEENVHDHLLAENIIAECLMMSFGETSHIRGGKYTRIDKQYELPNNELFKRLPFCSCGLPCDVKKCKDKDVLYFRCPRKNIWGGLRDSFECCDEPCNFYQEYSHDINLRNKSTWISKKHIISSLFAEED